MVDLRPQDKQGGFNVGSAKASAPVIKRREKIRLLLFLLGTGLFIVLMVDYWNDAPPPPIEKAPVSEESPDPELTEMAMVDLQRLGELPSYEQIKARAADVDALLRDDKLVRYHLQPVDDLSFAWARAQLERDRDDRPLPQSFSAEDFVFGKVSHGRPVIATGTLIELRESAVPGLEDERWFRLSLLLSNEDDVPVFMHVIAPEWAAPSDGDGDGLSPGLPLRVVGRYMGQAELPTGGGATETVPVVAASALAHRDRSSVTELMALSPIAETSRDKTWQPDPTILANIDDYPGNPRQSILERRPYYYLLGQVKLDDSTPGAYDDAVSIEEAAEALYQTPETHRGEVVTVVGKVWDAWYDEQVARDQPYGVGKVMRIWLWRVVYGIGDKPFRDLYELAVVAPSGQELPRRGETISATGRFLKVHMYYTPVSQFTYLLDDGMENNDKVLFKFVVVPEFEVIPEPTERDYLPWKITFLVISASFFLIMGLLILRDHRHEDDYKTGVKRLRENRRKLQRSRTVATEDAHADGGESDGTGDSGDAETGADDDGEGPKSE